MSIPTIRLIDLIPDGTNFKDRTFEDYVDKWMNRMMPGFPMGLLDTDGENAFERWRLEPQLIHEVRRATRPVFTCSECGDCDEPCDDEHEDEEAVERSETVVPVFVVLNRHTGDYLSNQRYIRHERLREDFDNIKVEGQDVLGWDDEDEAKDVAETADQAYQSEHGNESHGFPWAHSWAFLPDRYISDDVLRQAGFRVATYCGGSGNWRNDQEFRLAGIDGGGYSFFGTHFARLVALHHESRNMTVQTSLGDAYITTETRTDLEILAEDGSP